MAEHVHDQDIVVAELADCLSDGCAKSSGSRQCCLVGRVACIPELLQCGAHSLGSLAGERQWVLGPGPWFVIQAAVQVPEAGQRDA